MGATNLELAQRSAVEHAYATALGADPDELVGGTLSIVERPTGIPWSTAIMATFATGSIVSMAGDLLELARSLAPSEHRAVTSREFLDPLNDAARAAGHDLTIFGPSIGWCLRSMPGPPALPNGARLEPVDAAWLNDRIEAGDFPNGAGAADGSAGRAFRNQYGVAALDATDRVVALAGVFETFSMHEIGVDVVSDHQGIGLGRAIVTAAVHAIVERGAIPFYGCGPSNIRSQRTALSVGFVPVCADASLA